MSTAGAFLGAESKTLWQAGRYKVLMPLSRENKDSHHARKTGPWYLLGFFSKFPTSIPILFTWEPPDKRTRNKHVLCDFASCLQNCLVCSVKEREILSSWSLVESMWGGGGGNPVGAKQVPFLRKGRRRYGRMVSVFDSGASGPDLSPGNAGTLCFVLGKNSHH